MDFCFQAHHAFGGHKLGWLDCSFPRQKPMLLGEGEPVSIFGTIPL